MQFVILPLLAGFLLNGLATKPQSAADLNAALLKQFTSPVISVGGPYNQ